LSDVSPLGAAVLRDFNSALGPPTSAEGKGTQWTVQAVHGASLEVLVIDHTDSVSVWVIDASNPIDGVHGEVLTRADQTQAVIALIRRCVATPWLRTR
jgi:hypothetical protein